VHVPFPVATAACPIAAIVLFSARRVLVAGDHHDDTALDTPRAVPATV